MKKLTSIGILAWGLCIIFPDFSISTEDYRAVIIDYGLYVAKDIKTKKTDYGTSAISKVEKLLKQTDLVPARIGTTFGFRYEIMGNPDEGLVELIVKAIIPEPGLTNPETGKTFHDLTFLKKKVKIGMTHHEFLTFEEKWDLVPGKWKIQL